MKRAIIAASAGTADAAAIESCILPVERALASAFPGWEVRRVFTSRRIAERTGADTEVEAIARLAGYDEVVIASLHLLPGGEYGRLLQTGLPVSASLLQDDSDLRWMANLLGRIAGEEGRTLLAAGHGSDTAGETWNRLEGWLPEDVCFARLDDLPAEIAKNLSTKEITLLPLMLTAGRHARRDLGGGWKAGLEALGFDVRVRLEGLGARAEVRERFIQKAGKIIKG